MTTHHLHPATRLGHAFFSTTIIFLFIIGVRTAYAGKADSLFYAKLEHELRRDYFACTGDTAHLPVQDLVVWKHWADSIIGLPGYDESAKLYREKTGRSPVKDGPCAVVVWKLRYDSLTAASKENSELSEEVNALPKLPCALAGIPFGITRQSFVKLARKAGFTQLSDEGDAVLCPKTPVGEQLLFGRFHFDRHGMLDRYELEGPSVPVDSLDRVVWPLAENLTSFFWNMIGAPPLIVNRVNRQEIVEGKLSLCKVWTDPLWSVAIGLSVKKYRYYVKAVVTNSAVAGE
jgi:hypothetical protein